MTTESKRQELEERFKKENEVVVDSTGVYDIVESEDLKREKENVE